MIFDKFKIFKIMDTRGPDNKGYYKKQNKNLFNKFVS